MIGLVQDSLLGIHLLCRNEMWFDRSQAMELFFASYPNDIPLLPCPAIVKPTCLWSGLQIVSNIIPSFVNITSKLVIIQSGHIMSGVLNKRNVGRSGGRHSLVHILACKNNTLCEFVNAAQRLAHKYLEMRGFSTGIGDCMITDDIKEYIDNLLSDEKNLNEKIRDKIGERVISEGIDKQRNGLFLMSEAGSKGSLVNISQVMGCLGQQTVSGSNPGKLPHFHKEDVRGHACGFISSNYRSGLSPTEFYYHAMSGREGIIDTAVKTAESGYLERKLVKAIEDISVKYDETVRNDVGEVIQFKYGADNLDSSRLMCVGDNILSPFDMDELLKTARGLPTLNSFYVTPSAAHMESLILSIDVHRLRCYVEKYTTELMNMSCMQFTYVAGEIRRSLQQHSVHAGEMVGMIAATSIAEPATQLTLNTFHMAGIASARMHLNSGVPRLLELLNCTKSPKTPSCCITGKQEGFGLLMFSLSRCRTGNIRNVYQIEDDVHQTEGTNLSFLFRILPYSIALHVTTNHPQDALDCLGIEACRCVLLHEIKKVLEVNSYIDPRHIELLVDVMCHYGYLRPVNRHGIMKTHSVLKRASFESTMRTFTDAAIGGLRDELNGVSSSIMLGRLIPGGTGLPIALHLNEQMLEKQPTQKHRCSNIFLQKETKKKRKLYESPFASPDVNTENAVSSFSPAFFDVGSVMSDDASTYSCPNTPISHQNDDAVFSPIVLSPPKSPAPKRSKKIIKEAIYSKFKLNNLILEKTEIKKDDINKKTDHPFVFAPPIKKKV